MAKTIRNIIKNERRVIYKTYVGWLSQFILAVCELAVLSKRTRLVIHVVTAHLGLVFVLAVFYVVVR